MYGVSLCLTPCMANHRCEKRSSWAQLVDHRIPSPLLLFLTDPLCLRHMCILFLGLFELYINIRYQYLCSILRNQTLFRGVFKI